MIRDLVTKILRFFKLVRLDEYLKLNTDYHILQREKDFYANMCIIDGDKVIKKVEQVYYSSSETASVSIGKVEDKESLAGSAILLDVDTLPLSNRGPFTTIYLEEKKGGE